MNVRLDTFIGISSVVCIVIILSTMYSTYNANKLLLQETKHDQIHVKFTNQDSLLRVTDSLLFENIKQLKQENTLLSNEIKNLQRSVYSNRFKISTIENSQNDK